MKTIVDNFKGLTGMAQKAGPYVFMEVLLPGGTLFVLLLFLYRHWPRIPGLPMRVQPAAIVERAIEELRGAVLSVQPYDIAAVANSDAANDADGLGPLAMLPERCA